MSRGNENIVELGKGTQFTSTNQPDNRGRKPSIKKQLTELLSSEGVLRIPAKQVKSIDQDGNVEIKIPKQDAMAMKLMQWAMSGKGTNSLKALQMIMEQIDGKPKQALTIEDYVNTPSKYEVINGDN